MKKTLLILGLALGFLSASAQEEAKGNFTHQKGDMALSIDATPFLEYVGNAFNTGFNSAPNFGDWQIMGRYFLTEKSAIRVGLGINFNSYTNKWLVDDVTSTATPPAQVENSASTTLSNFRLDLGYELRRGEGRLQAFYGGGIYVSSNNGEGSTSFKYGNALSATNPYYRMTEAKNGASIGFGLSGFLGVEYFITSNIALGGQVSLGLGLQTAAKGKSTVEYWENNSVKTESTDEYSSGSSFGINTAGSGIYLSFFF